MPNGNGHPANLSYLPHWNYLPKLKGLSGIYLNTAIRDFAFGVLGILIPIYIYQTTHSLSSAILFYLIHRIATLIAAYPTAKIISKFGPDFSMFISSFIAAIYLTFLSMLPDTPNLIWITALLGGIQLTLHWLPYHTAFSSVTKEKNLIKNITNASTLSQLVRTLAPLAGGFFAARFGFPSLLLASVLLLTVSTLPIFLDEYNHKNDLMPFKNLISGIFKSKKRNLNCVFFFRGFRIAIDGAIWPLVLYSVITNFTQIGGLTTLSLLIAFIGNQWISRKLKHFKYKPFAAGNLVKSTLWLLRAAASQPLIVALTDPIYQLATLFVNIPRTILVYQLGKRQKLNFFTQREFVLSAGRVAALLLVFLFIKAGLPWKLIPLLPIGGITMDNYFMYQYSKRQKGLLEQFRIKLTRL